MRPLAVAEQGAPSVLVFSAAAHHHPCVHCVLADIGLCNLQYELQVLAVSHGQCRAEHACQVAATERYCINIMRRMGTDVNLGGEGRFQQGGRGARAYAVI